MLTNLQANFRYSRIFLPEVLLIDIIILICAIIFLPIDSIVTLLIILISVTIISLNLIGRKRRIEIYDIRSIIKGIRKNKYNSAEEIKLSKALYKLERNIRAMFVRTQEDIASMKKLELARTEFLGNVSHELRTPIFAIQGFIETLLGGALNDPNVNMAFLEKANNHTNNLNELLNDLIDISMIESGQMSMSFQKFSVKKFLENIISDFYTIAENKNIELKLNKFPENLELYGDEDRLHQVVTNLVSNAIKYTQNGKVEILVEDKGKQGKIKVRDSGLGIPEEEMNRVFERFYRTKRERAGKIRGTGLGLAIVKHIIDAHGSKIELISDMNIGSEFSFVLEKEPKVDIS